MAAAARTGGRSRSAPLPGAVEEMGMEEEEVPLLGRRRSERQGRMRSGITAAGFTVIGLAVGIIVGRLSTSDNPAALPATTRARALPPPPPRSTGAELLFDQLNPEEVSKIAEAMFAMTGAAPSLALQTKSSQAFISGTGSISLIPPKKKEAIAFLDKNGPLPPRYAKVQVARPMEGDVVEYKCGPIEHLLNDRKKPMWGGAQACELMTGGPKVPIARRPPEMADTCGLVSDAAVVRLREPLIKIFGNRWPTLDGHNPDAEGSILSWTIFPDMLSTSASRITMVKYFWIADLTQLNVAMWLHPVPLVMRINQTGSDPAAWHIHGIFVCTKGPYATTDDVLSAHKRGEFDACRYKPDPSTGPGAWDTPGPGPGDKGRTEQRAPGQSMPDGRRWSSTQLEGGMGKQVSWMGWEFFVTNGAAKGPSAWDIRFKGKRVVYELSLQEAAAVYGGGQGDQTYYADNSITGNHLAPNLNLGIDCPAQAEHLDITTWMGFDPARKHSGAVNIYADPHRAQRVHSGCIFEMDTAKPVWSHTNVVKQGTYGVRGTQLVVRTLMNSGNYDYFFQFKFNLDGSMEFESDFAGFMESRWYDPEFNSWETEVSAIIHPGLAAPLHTHLLCAKVDIDIGHHGHNSLRKLSSVVGQPYNGSKIPGVWDPVMPTKYITSEYITNEGIGKSTFVHDPAKPAVWTVVNREQEGPVSKYGSPPGYAIVVGEAMVNTLPDSHPLSKYIAFAKYTAAFTAHKDAEQFVTSPYDVYMPGEPFVSLDNYIADGDSLDDNDVVAWVSMNHEHMPRSEDVPLISNYPLSFKILPWNFFDRLAANDLPEVRSSDSEL